MSDQEHPIVERPEPPESRKFAQFPGQWAMDAWAYIEWLEGRLSFDQERNMDLHKCQDTNRALLNELHQAKAIIEGLTAERDRAEQFAKDIEKGSKVSRKSLEKEIDI